MDGRLAVPAMQNYAPFYSALLKFFFPSNLELRF